MKGIARCASSKKWLCLGSTHPLQLLVFVREKPRSRAAFQQWAWPGILQGSTGQGSGPAGAGAVVADSVRL